MDFSVEYLQLDQLRTLQSERFVRLVQYLGEKSEFYAGKFMELGLSPEDIRSIDDIAKLPVTYKQDLRDNYPFGYARFRKTNCSGFTVPAGQLASPRW